MNNIKPILLCLLIFPLLLGAANNPRYFWLSVEIESKQDLNSISQLPVSIDNIVDGNAIVYSDSVGLKALRSRGFIAQIIPPDSRLGKRLYPGPMDGYHSYAELTALMHSYEDNFPSLCRLDSLGPSVNGRWLWQLLITDNPDSSESEPQVRYISTMHGDEPVGTEMLINLMDSIFSAYSTDASIREIVDNMELWILPLMNPDGFVDSTRYNANGIDLNRNFPVPNGIPGDDGTYELEPETEAVMNFSLDKNFVLSANFHTGATVVNYVWDYTSVRAPDDSLCRLIALDYAYRNEDMWNSTVFDYGITNGYDWYVVYGSMQDWMYNRGELDFTIELWDTKWPSSSTLPYLWEQNRESMFAFIRWGLTGVQGVVTDSATGLPVEATIEPEVGQFVKSDSVTGFYRKIIYPGVFQFNFSSPGYRPETLTIEVPVTGDTTLNVALVPNPPSYISGNIDLMGTEDDSGVIVSITQNGFKYQDTTSADGFFEIGNLRIPGEWTFRTYKDNYADTTFRFSIESAESLYYAITLWPRVTYFSSDFEDDNGGLTESGDAIWEWGGVGDAPLEAYSGDKVWGTVLDWAYPHNSLARLTLPPVAIPEWCHPRLTFYQWYQFEYAESIGRYYDGGNVQISVDGGEDSLIYPVFGYPCTIWSSNDFIGGEPAFGGESGGWEYQMFDLSELGGHTLTVKFVFASDPAVARFGWYIDDVALWCPDYRVNVVENEIVTKPSLFTVYPNPANATLGIKTSLKRFTLELYNIRGQRVLTAKDRKILQLGGLPSGVYFVRVYTENYEERKRFILMK